MDSTTQRPPSRATAWGGIVFAVLYVAGVVMMLGPTPNDAHKNQPAKFAADWNRMFADSGNRTQMILGAYVLAAACVAVVVFGSSLRDRLAGAGAATSGRLAFAGSIMFATITLAGAAAIAWIPGAKAFGDAPIPKGELAYLAPQLGFGALLLGGGATAGLMLVAAGIGSARTRALPAWLGWAGVVVGVLIFLFGAFFMPMLLLVLWVLIAAIVSLRRPFTA
jgi:hypothetical protein